MVDTTVIDEEVFVAEQLGNKAVHKKSHSDGSVEQVEYPEAKRTVTFYDTKTGEASEILASNYRQALKQKHPDGTPQYTANKALAPEPFRGKMKCWFHPESDMRGELDEAGLGGITCATGAIGEFGPKENLRSVGDVLGHVKAAHTQAYEAFEMWRADQERDEERAVRKALIGQTQIKCEECDLSFTRDQDLKAHNTKVHA